jgi:hypothetical protein
MLSVSTFHSHIVPWTDFQLIVTYTKKVQLHSNLSSRTRGSGTSKYRTKHKGGCCTMLRLEDDTASRRASANCILHIATKVQALKTSYNDRHLVRSVRMQDKGMYVFNRNLYIKLQYAYPSALANLTPGAWAASSPQPSLHAFFLHYSGIQLVLTIPGASSESLVGTKTRNLRHACPPPDC